MDALVMCGGRGTRLGSHLEKPLVRVGGEPAIDRVLAALRTAGIDRVLAAPSPATPATRERLSIPCVGTPGDGYVADLRAALADDRVRPPVLTVAADLALLPAAAVGAVLDEHATGPLTAAVPVATKRDLGVSADATVEHRGRTVAPCGLNVVTGEADEDSGTALVLDDPDLAVNVNRPADLAVARRRVWSGAASASPDAARKG